MYTICLDHAETGQHTLPGWVTMLPCHFSISQKAVTGCCSRPALESEALTNELGGRVRGDDAAAIVAAHRQGKQG
jgi:hypothetical protein